MRDQKLFMNGRISGIFRLYMQLKYIIGYFLFLPKIIYVPFMNNTESGLKFIAEEVENFFEHLGHQPEYISRMLRISFST